MEERRLANMSDDEVMELFEEWLFVYRDAEHGGDGLNQDQIVVRDALERFAQEE